MTSQSITIGTRWRRIHDEARYQAGKSGRRWRVRQIGTIWEAHEVDQPITARKPEPKPEATVPTTREGN